MAAPFTPKRVQVPGLLSDEGFAVALKEYTGQQKTQTAAAPPPTSAVEFADSIVNMRTGEMNKVLKSGVRKPSPLKLSQDQRSTDIGGAIAGGVAAAAGAIPFANEISQLGTLKPDEQEAEQKLRIERARAEEQAYSDTAELEDRMLAMTDAERFASGLPEGATDEEIRQLIRQQNAPTAKVTTEARVEAEKAPLPTQTWWLNAAQTGARSAAQMGVGTLKYPVDIWELTAGRAFAGGDIRNSEAGVWLDGVDKALTKMLPGDPARSKEFLTELSAGAGSMAAFLIAGFAGRAVGYPAALVSGALGAAVGGNAAYEESEQFNATGTQKYLALILGSGLGASEAIPIDRMFMRADAASGGMIRRMLTNTTSSTIEEFTQEAGQAMGEDLIAKYGAFYDPERELDAGAWLKQGVIGGIVGGGAGAITTLVPGPTGETQQTIDSVDDMVLLQAVNEAINAEQARFNDIIGDEAVAAEEGAPEAGTDQAPTGAAAGVQTPAEEAAAPRVVTGDAVQQMAMPEQMVVWTPPLPLFPEVTEQSFDRFFGDSAVRAPSGEPRIVYHGTPTQPFSAFDPARTGTTSVLFSAIETHRQGFFFAESQDFAQGFADQRQGGSVMPVYLAVQNPLDASESDNATVAKAQAIADEIERLDPEYNTDFFMGRLGQDDFWEVLDTPEGGETVVQAMRNLGYDGIKMGEPNHDTGATETVWVAFDPTQIKSATQNSGAYSPADPDIERQVAQPAVSRQQLDAIELDAQDVSPLPAIEAGLTGPIPLVVKAAKAYAEASGIPHRRQREYVRVDTARASRIAQAYQDMPHQPQDPAVIAAYRAMADETVAQYQFVKATGLKIDAIQPGQPDPYPAGPRDVLKDIASGHIWYYPTDQGFGTEGGLDTSDNPLLESTSEVSDNGSPMVVNDVFRVVHDFFGHGLEGSGFGARGEENVWQSHMRLYSASAVSAMTSETRGQNSWVNYGPHGEHNRANPRETIYADQKSGIMPSWTWQEGVANSMANEIDGPVETRDAGQFHTAIMAAKEASAFGAVVHAYTPAEYAKMKLFLTPDGLSGFALKGEDIVSVFSHNNAPRGRLRLHIDTALANGGRTLDAFDGFLPKAYAALGFREVRREPWSAEHKPEGWRDDMGTPDVVFMAYIGVDVEQSVALAPNIVRDVETSALLLGALSREQMRAINTAADAGEWQQAVLPLNRLVASQESVNDDFRQAAARNTDLPLVIHVNGQNVVRDGHHRVAAAAAEGAQAIRVRYIDIDGSMVDPDQSILDFMTGTASTRMPYAAEPTRPTKGIAAPLQADAQPDDTKLTQISRNFVKLLNLTARHGRLVGGKDVFGEYNRRTGVVRMRVWSDLSTLVHEGGHAINDAMSAPLNAFVNRNLPLIGKIANTYYPGDLSQASGQTVSREGFAEFFRVYALTPDFARNKWPQLSADFEQTLDANDPKLREGLNAIANQFKAWLMLPSKNLIRNMIVDGRRPNGLNAAVKELRDIGFKSWWQEVTRRQVEWSINRFAPLNRLVTDLLNAGEANLGTAVDLKRADDPRTIARLARNAGSRAMVEVTDGVIGYRSTQASTRGLRDAIMVSQGIDPNSTPGSLDEDRLTDFDAYLVALRGLAEYDRFDAGELDRPPAGFSKGDAIQAVRDYDKQYGTSFNEAATIIHDYGMGLWRKQFDAGLMTKQTYEDGLTRKFYAPLQRDMSDKQAQFGDSALTAQGSGRLRSIVKRFHGSDRDIISPTAILMHKTFALEQMIAENDAKKAMAMLADRVGEGSLVERIPATQVIGMMMSVEDAARQLVKDDTMSPTDAADLMTILGASIKEGNSINLFRRDQVSTKGENVLFFWENGKPAAIQLKDGDLGADVVNTMNAVGRENMDWFMEAIAGTSTVFRTAITSWPDFLVVNFIRDQMSAWILNDVGFVPFASGLKGMAEELRQKSWAKQYSAAQGIMGGMNVAALHEARVDRDIRSLRSKGYVAQAFSDKTPILGAIRGLGRISALSETGTRLGLYKGAYQRALAEGLNEYEASVEAAYIATDYIDFGLNGNRMLTARRTIPFLNAQLQGLYKMMRTLGADEVAQRRGLKFVLGAYFKSTRNMPLSRVEKQQLNTGRKAWLKMMSLGVISAALHFLFEDDPDYQEAGEYLRVTGWVIPMGDGRVFYVPKPFELAMIANAVERGLESAAGDSTAKDKFMRGLAFSLTPPTSPPAIQVAVEAIANRDFFTGREIVPSYMQGLDPMLQYDNYTSSLAKWLGQATGQSPMVVDHILSGMGASAYRDLSAALNAADPTRPSLDNTDMPLLRRFVRDARRGSTSAEAFWSQASQRTGALERASQTYKRFVEQGNQPAANRYMATLDADQQAYATLMTHFKTDEKRLNPFYRARQMTTIISGMRREIASELSLGDTLIKDSMETIPLTSTKKQQLDEILSELARREVRNTLIATEQPGWRGKEMLPIEPTEDMLLALSPDVYDEYKRRVTKKKVYNAQSVFEYWPEVRDRLVQDGEFAVLADAVAVSSVVF